MAKKKRNSKRDIVGEFDRYFGSDKRLENWKRLCADLDLEGHFSSITSCRKALDGVWVNIYDFLDDVNGGRTVRRHVSERALAKYTLETRKIYPKARAKEQGPVRALLAHIFS